MQLRTVILLLLGVAAAQCQQCQQTPETGSNTNLAQALTNGFNVIRDIFYIFYGNDASFRNLLATVSDLVAELVPPSPVPAVPEQWWGAEDRNDTRIRPFKVHFSDEMISDLRARIAHRRRITPSLSGAVHTYGSDADYLATFLDDWANNYDFKAREDWLNSFPQYVTNIQGLDIHYIHVKPANPGSKKVLPLLLLHGWPVTAFEYVHVIQLLTAERDDSDFVFEIIAPDLPGFGYSEATDKIGMSNYQIGIIMKNLMERVGKPQFYIHAGDVGQMVGDNMAVLFPDKVLGLHTNFPFSLRTQTLVKVLLGSLFPSAVVEAQYEDRMYPLSERGKFYLEYFGYLHLQGTKPDNAGHGVDDSPVAQASWLIQSIISGAGIDNQYATNGNLTKLYDIQDWFDSFTIYWNTQCMNTAMRLYAESLAMIQDPLISVITSSPTSVPFAAIRFRNEIIYMPDDFLRDKYPNLVQTTTVDFGGHFVGYEEPATLADSIWTSVTKMEQFHLSQEEQ